MVFNFNLFSLFVIKMVCFGEICFVLCFLVEKVSIIWLIWFVCVMNCMVRSTWCVGNVWWGRVFSMFLFNRLVIVR